MASTINTSIEIVIDLVAGEATVTNYVVPRAGKVTDVRVIATATSGGGTVTVGKGASAITAALACAAAGTLTRAAALTQANVSFAAGDSLRLTKGNDSSGVSPDAGTVVVTLSVAGAALA